jgi:hypothetical protein
MEREAITRGTTEPAIVAPALQRIFARTCDNLRDAMGDDGCDALVARARARVERSHPALEDLCRRRAGDLQVEDVLATIDAYDVDAITAAVEVFLAALIEILSRLIGEDMAIRLIDHDVPRSRPNGGAHAP